MIAKEKVREIHEKACAAKEEISVRAGLYRMSELPEPGEAVAALYATVEALSRDELFDLAAIMWLGRGDFDSFVDARDYADAMKPSAGYVLAKSPLHRYLGKVIEQVP